MDALDVMRHRGPDDEGYVCIDTSSDSCIQALGADSCSVLRGKYRDLEDTDITTSHVVLGHRRLAILDVSSKGHQPMSFDNDNLWITYNGEIFNYKELRRELQGSGCTFSSGTDTEVILAAYSKWGEDCVSRFNGQWAFCIYDKRKKKLFCSRDRFGIKPFYYWFDGAHFAFASEIKALLRIPFVKRELNKQLLFELFVFHMMHHSEESMYRGIYQLLPSHNLTFDPDRKDMSIKRYYELPYTEELGRYDERQACRYADDIRDLLIDSVRVRLISEVPVGSCLSGGLDSSSIVAIINRLLREGTIDERAIGKRQKTFTASFDNPCIDETGYAEEVIRHTGVESFFVYPTADGLWKELDNFLFSHDELCKNTNVYAGWVVMRLASRHVKVVLNGQGSDELFGGYPQYEPVYLADMIRRMRVKDLCRFFSGERKRYGLRRTFSDCAMGGYLAFAPDSLKKFLFKERSRKQLKYIEHLLGEVDRDASGLERMTERMRSLNHLLYRDTTRDYLRELLKDDDRNAAAFSIENRVPFVDHRLVEYVSGIPSIYKMYRGWSKWLLRLAMRDLLPEKIVWRKDKIGFATPVESWIRHEYSPIPLAMSQLGRKGQIPYFLWKLYLVQRLLARHEQKSAA
jgi:asparagine synthase (glutamine-hydrolysing)